jgi:hypothetical protein
MTRPSVMAIGVWAVLLSPMWTETALAMNESLIRNLDSTTVGNCPNGKLWEHYYGGGYRGNDQPGGIGGTQGEVQVVCMTSKETAVWIWIAGYQCYGIKTCLNGKQSLAFGTPYEHYVTDRDEFSRTMTYHAKKAVMGGNCKMRSYKTKFQNQDDSSMPTYFWDCETYENLQPESGVIIVVTIGPTKRLLDTDDQAPNLPLTLSIPEDNYIVNEGRR